MEQSFDTDFSAVRIHESNAAQQINALAYTQGQHIHFQPGKYKPDSPKGQELLGHELTHVVQQQSGQVTQPQGKGLPINTDTHLETEADQLGVKAARGETVQVQGSASGIQRAPMTIEENRQWLKKVGLLSDDEDDAPLANSQPDNTSTTIPFDRTGPGPMTTDESQQWLKKVGLLWTDDEDNASVTNDSQPASSPTISPFHSAGPGPMTANENQKWLEK